MTAAMHLGIAMQGNAMHGDVTQDMTFDEVRIVRPSKKPRAPRI